VVLLPPNRRDYRISTAAGVRDKSKFALRIFAMKPRGAKKQFLEVLRAKGRRPSSLTPAEGVAVMLDFYRDERAEGCELDKDGEMLLYQWGCYDWGEGEFFEFDITRQFIDGAGEDEDIRQLHLTFKFEPTEALRKVKEGNHWCHSPKDLAAFRSYVDSSKALKAIADAVPVEVSLELEIAG
jgi:hypothetical protein